MADRQGHKQAARQKAGKQAGDKQTRDRQTGRQTDKETGETGSWGDKHTDRQSNMLDQR